MISVERLKELLDKGATIYCYDYGRLKLDKKNCEICETISFNEKHQVIMGHILQFAYFYDNERYVSNVELDYLDEDVEKAEWHYEMDASRSENFIPITYEEFLKDNIGFGFYRDASYYKIHKIRCSANDNDPRWKIELYITYGNDFDDVWREWQWDLTKENYKLAITKMRNLFKGGKVND